MNDRICLDGVEHAMSIKKRSRALGKTVKAIFREANVAYRTYKSWRGAEANPSFASLKLVDAVLRKHEARKTRRK